MSREFDEGNESIKSETTDGRLAAKEVTVDQATEETYQLLMSLDKKLGRISSKLDNMIREAGEGARLSRATIRNRNRPDTSSTGSTERQGSGVKLGSNVGLDRYGLRLMGDVLVFNPPTKRG